MDKRNARPAPTKSLPSKVQPYRCTYRFGCVQCGWYHDEVITITSVDGWDEVEAAQPACLAAAKESHTNCPSTEYEGETLPVR